MTWEDEVRLLQRELDRSWSSLMLEEHNNRNLPELEAANTPEEFKILTENGVERFMKFIKDKEIMPFKENMEPALREHMGKFVPSEDVVVPYTSTDLASAERITHVLRRNENEIR